MNIRPIEYFEDNDLPIGDYYAQYKASVPVVGEIYRQKGVVYWVDFKIVYVGEGVALGVEVANGNGSYGIGSKCLFVAGGAQAGWKYKDPRPQFLLKEKKQHEQR